MLIVRNDEHDLSGHAAGIPDAWDPARKARGKRGVRDTCSGMWGRPSARPLNDLDVTGVNPGLQSGWRLLQMSCRHF